jgi:hypothetical protein
MPKDKKDGGEYFVAQSTSYVTDCFRERNKMKSRLTIYSLGIMLTAITATYAQSPSPSATDVVQGVD